MNFPRISRGRHRFAAISAATTLLALGAIGNASAATLSVGPGKTFSTPCQAIGAARPGDLIEIDGSGNYWGDVCGIYASNVTIRGVNGRPKIDAGGRNAMGKGTWVVIGNDITVENVEMFGAKVPDQNGAAIRLDGRNLTVRNSYLHHNENGILTNNDGVSNIVIENTEFDSNGFGTGYTHNLYIGHVNSLIFKGSYSHDANVGHNLKSRAKTNTILYSRFSSTTGRPSYEIDLPNAGTAYIIGNVIQQPANHSNPGMLTFGVEGASNPGKELYVVNNTFLNDDSSRGTFVVIGGDVTTPAVVQNNIFSGTGTSISQSNAVDKNNYRSTSPAFVDRASFDLRPASGSPMINGGATPSNSAAGLSLVPTLQYKHKAGSENRVVNGAIDIGAYEASGVTTSPVTEPAPAPTNPAPPPTSPGTWTYCANEDGLCSFSGTLQVRYGANGQYAYKTATGSIWCNNGNFGDPVYGVSKKCEYLAAAAAPAPAPAPTPVPSPSPETTAWTFCATEFSTCNFSGTMQVRYGVNGKYAYRTVTGPVACGNGEFGDPAYGEAKSCYTAPAAQTVSWVNCAGENGTCSFSGTRQVRYGADGKYVYKSATGAIACNNSTFGDPAFGITKKCDYSN